MRLGECMADFDTERQRMLGAVARGGVVYHRGRVLRSAVDVPTAPPAERPRVRYWLGTWGASGWRWQIMPERNFAEALAAYERLRASYTYVGTEVALCVKPET